MVSKSHHVGYLIIKYYGNLHSQWIYENTGSRIWKLPMEFHRDALKSWMHFLSTKLGKDWLEDSVLNKTVELSRKKKTMSQADSQSPGDALV